MAEFVTIEKGLGPDGRIAVVRFAFARDATGRVTSLSRLIYGSVVSWPRVP